MSKIKGKDSKPEVKFRKALWHLGYRYRKNYKKLIGKPDIVFQKYKTVIFIDGEFWHGYKWNEKKENIKCFFGDRKTGNIGLRTGCVG